ncbi:cytochrome P450 [Coprinopsis marcescibilis]|uniref:Cytochrome P450 n=1 Tax=Coprinopsis marcescibilis TaxID=230819 RepID=A0A5C3KR14_COPMA|nr:cytochrome P450 [Coprinopsis marcescibilis]
MGLPDLQLSLPQVLAALGIPLAVLYTFTRLSRRRSELPLPPGPPKRFLLGNLLDIPKEFPYVTYTNWGKEYDSDILHVQAGKTSLIIINSFEAANALLEKRSLIYSSRKQSTLLGKLVGWGWIMSALPYGDHWRRSRSLFQRHFNTHKDAIHHPRQMRFVRGYLLPKLLEGSDRVDQIVRHMVGGLSLSVAYGIRIKRENDPYVHLGEAAVDGLVQAGTPGRYLVDSIPILRYIPSWFPGAGFQEEVRRWREFQEGLHEKPFHEALRLIEESEGAQSSFVATCLGNISETSPDKQYRHELIKDVAAVIFAAGVDTLAASVEAFFLAIASHPEVRRRAQAELDKVVGADRLPTIEDMEELPFITAIVKETLRWVLALPARVPHFLTEDDTYKGYHIPKNSIVVGNAWAMLRNEEDYPEPDTFKPERFLNADGSLNPNVRDPATAAFGFGRRMCPGKDYAFSIVWLAAASVLSSFDVVDVTDENGVTTDPGKIPFRTGIVRHPDHFRIKFKARSRTVEELIDGEEERFQG